MFSDQNFVYISRLALFATRPAHLNVLYLMTVLIIIFGEDNTNYEIPHYAFLSLQHVHIYS